MGGGASRRCHGGRADWDTDKQVTTSVDEGKPRQTGQSTDDPNEPTPTCTIPSATTANEGCTSPRFGRRAEYRKTGEVSPSQVRMK